MRTSSSETGKSAGKGGSGGLIAKALVVVIGIVLATLVNVGLTYALEPYGSYAELKWYLYRGLEPKSIDTLIVGSSYAQLNLFPAAIDEDLGSTSFNMGMPAQSLDNSLAAIKQAYEDHGITRVILTDSINTMIQVPWSYSSVTFTQGKGQGESIFEQVADWARFLTDPHFFGTGASVHAIFPWSVNSVSKTPESISQNIKNRLNGDIIAAAHWVDPKLHDNGQGYWCAEYSGNLNNVGRKVTAASYAGKSFDEGNVRTLREIGAFCQEKGIELVVVNTPRPDFEALAYGDEYPEKMQLIQDLVAEYGGVLIDGELMRSDVYDPPESDFMDKEHLSRTGAWRFGKVLGSAIAAWEETGSIEDFVYSYDEWDEYCESVDEISLVNFAFEVHEGYIYVAATSYQGTDVTPEYAFAFKNADGSYETVQDWSESRAVTIETEGHGLTRDLYVFARQAGSTDDDTAYERYYHEMIRY